MNLANPDFLVTLGVTAAYVIVIVLASTGLFLILEATGLFDRLFDRDEST